MTQSFTQQITFYTEDHEWVTVHGDLATVGITRYAADQLGDVVFVETPEVGKVVKKGDEMAVVESVKAASDVYAPLSGEIIDANGKLADAPETVNEHAESEGWFCVIKFSNGAETEGLMDKDAYYEFCKGQS
ncbi:glycine cleavage system protein GcvH [Henriciella sp. AS95]|uniref:glycine cleavage system protein GcvH n=1 Tax=Henriciella sp. AS95 TaxID=3135782 RepID=UPI0031785CBE